QREDPRLAIRLGEGGVVGEVGEAHLRMRRRLAVGDEVELGVGIAWRDALDEQLVQPVPALASLPEPDVEQARLLTFLAGMEYRVIDSAADDALHPVHLGFITPERDGDGGEPVRQRLGAVQQVLQRAARRTRGVLRFAERGAVERAHRGAWTPQGEPVVAMEVYDVLLTRVEAIEQRGEHAEAARARVAQPACARVESAMIVPRVGGGGTEAGDGDGDAELHERVGQAMHGHFDAAELATGLGEGGVEHQDARILDTTTTSSG